VFPAAEETLSQILALVGKCPDKLQEKCFELLLQAYLDAKVRPAVPMAASATPSPNSPPSPPAPAAPQPDGGGIPDAVRGRFKAVAGRMAVPVEKLAALFDFNLDPYNFHALVVPGENKAERNRNVGLLLCAKSYLMMSDWTADWKEFRAVCLDQGCWDQANVAAHLGKKGQFKTISAADGLALSSTGITEAQALLTKLASTDGT
jgi:hypothetical protein